MTTLQHGSLTHLSTPTAPTPPTTTYAFTYTTASGLATPLPFTLPFYYPNYHAFPARRECCAPGSQTPQNPDSRNASCAISNAACDNPSSFWDLQICCNGGKPEEAGYDNYGVFTGCTAQCDAIGQSWQELQACLELRAKVVVCKPDDAEIGGGRATSTWSTHAAAFTGPVVSSASEVSSHDCGYVKTEVDKDHSTYILLGTSCKVKAVPTATASSITKGVASGVEAVRWSKLAVAVSAVVVLGSLAGMLG